VRPAKRRPNGLSTISKGIVPPPVSWNHTIANSPAHDSQRASALGAAQVSPGRKASGKFAEKEIGAPQPRHVLCTDRAGKHSSAILFSPEMENRIN